MSTNTTDWNRLYDPDEWSRHAAKGYGPSVSLAITKHGYEMGTEPEDWWQTGELLEGDLAAGAELSNLDWSLVDAYRRRRDREHAIADRFIDNFPQFLEALRKWEQT